MPCWVVPTIAAELWGVPVEQILQRVRDGELDHCVDHGFMFVDVVPPVPPAPPQCEPPPTFTVLSAAEVEALRGDEQQPVVESPDDGVVHHDNEDDESQSPDDDEASVELGDWRTARQRVGRTRVPPGRRAKPLAA